jgi:Glycosyl transferases group 1
MRKKILIVSPVMCYPSYAGNSSRIAATYEQLVAKGFDVYYLHLPDGDFNPVEMIDKLKEKYFYRKFKTFNSVKIKLVFNAIKAILYRRKFRNVKIDDFLVHSDILYYQKILEKVKPGIVWINYTYYSKLFDYTPPEVLKILDTHDSIYLRFKQIFNNSKGYKNLKVSLPDEINCINRADHIVCIQPSEELFFRENGCIKKLCTIGHIRQFHPTVIRKKKNNLLYLASDYFIYADSINAFLKDVWPHLKTQRPEIQLLIAGKVGRKINKDQLDANITVLGIVNDLKKLYNSIDITINPVKQGSGLKIKVIESLCFCKPAITTAIGIEGLDIFEQKGLIVAETPEQWMTQIIRLLSDNDYYDHQILNLEERVNQYNKINIAIFEKLFS